MGVIVLYGGGKDSTYATSKVLKNGLEIKYLLTMVPKNPHSWMFHAVNIEVTRYQAGAMGIGHLIQHTSGKKDEEIEDLWEAIGAVKDEVDGVVSGAIASTYQRDHIKKICKKLGLVSITPLWGHDPLELLSKMLSTGLDILITSVSAEGFDESWLGRKLDKKCLEDLMEHRERYGINLSGEGGEYETLVLDASFFENRIDPVKMERIWRGDRGHLNIQRVRLVSKSGKLQ